ncbi:MAG: hypothetical protein RMI51_01845 [Aquificaceae bacterium]|nr:hypothetical protein [Aquificaceae bacterium]
MADFTKAGLDRGDLEKELENTLISARMLYRTYMVTIEELSKEELAHDLQEYTDQLNRFIMPLLKRAQATGDRKLVDMAYQIIQSYEGITEAIRKRLNTP